MLNRLRPLLLALAVCLLFQTALADPDYEISNYAMEIEVQPDGSAQVTETLIYQFDGEYNGILSLFDLDGVGALDDLAVYADETPVTRVDEMAYQPNTYTLSSSGNLLEARVYSPGADDTRVFKYEYVLRDLARRHEDCGMILRKFIGENNDSTLHNATVIIRFPQDHGQISAFAHGAMGEENISISGNQVTFGPANVSSGRYAEMRLLFPAEWLPDAPLIAEPVMEDALNEERLLEEAEAARLHRLRIAKYIYAAAYPLLMMLLLLLAARRYGIKRAPRQTPDPVRLTQWPAAFATDLYSGTPDTDALSGTLVELLQMGRLRMEPEGDDDLRFTLLNDAQDGLCPHQARALAWLFDRAPSVLLSELNAGDNYEQARRSESAFAEYCAQVTQEAAAHHLRYKNEGVVIALNVLSILLGGAGAAFTLLAGPANVPLGVGLTLLLFLFIYLSTRIRTLTDEGELLRDDAKALKTRGVLSDSSLKNFLPYYTALGMTEPLLTAMNALPRDTDSWADFYLYGGWSLHQMSRAMHDTHVHNASVPDPNASLSSGGGSSGSNGGGGGHGAW